LVSIPKIPKIEDLNPQRSKILVRIDINSPLDPVTGEIIDDTRFKAHIPTIKELIEKENAVVLMSHQGRPGSSDFTRLHNHARLLRRLSGIPVKFVDDIIGPAAREAIDKLNPGEVLLLDNTRLLSEEVIESVPERQARSIFVRTLVDHFDYYINDAFATAHRSQPSIVGFPLVLPSAMGRVMEKEVEALRRAFDPEATPKIFVLGGAKVHDTMRVIEHLVENKLADRILTTGLVAFLFMVSKGINVGLHQRRVMENRGILTLVSRARRLLLKGAPIEVPLDFVVEKDDGSVAIEGAHELDGPAKDIGPATIESYSELLKDASIIVMRGPAGVIEDERFRRGTLELVRRALDSNAFTIFGGGHFNAIISMLGEEYRGKAGHISTGGGALLLFLSGENLPALEALSISASQFLGW